MRGLTEGIGVDGMHTIRIDQTTKGTEGQTGKNWKKCKGGFLFCDLLFPRKTGLVGLSISPLDVYCYTRGGDTL